MHWFLDPACNCMHVQSCTWVSVLGSLLGALTPFGTGRLFAAHCLAHNTGGCALASCWSRGARARQRAGCGWGEWLCLHLCDLLQSLLKLLLECCYLCGLRSVLHTVPAKNVRHIQNYMTFLFFECSIYTILKKNHMECTQQFKWSCEVHKTIDVCTQVCKFRKLRENSYECMVGCGQIDFPASIPPVCMSHPGLEMAWSWHHPPHPAHVHDSYNRHQKRGLKQLQPDMLHATCMIAQIVAMMLIHPHIFVYIHCKYLQCMSHDEGSFPTPLQTVFSYKGLSLGIHDETHIYIYLYTCIYIYYIINTIYKPMHVYTF